MPKGQGSEQLWGIQAAGIERDVIPYVTQLEPPTPGRKGVTSLAWVLYLK